MTEPFTRLAVDFNDTDGTYLIARRVGVPVYNGQTVEAHTDDGPDTETVTCDVEFIDGNNIVYLTPDWSTLR